MSEERNSVRGTVVEPTFEEREERWGGCKSGHKISGAARVNAKRCHSLGSIQYSELSRCGPEMDSGRLPITYGQRYVSIEVVVVCVGAVCVANVNALRTR